MQPSDRVTYQRIDLERVRFAAQMAISKELIEDVATPIQTQWLEDRITDTLVYQIRTGIAAQHLDRAVIKHPLNWWEAVKAALYQWCSYDHWPWFGEDIGPKCWPVKEKVVTIDVKALYPLVAMPNEKHVVTVMRQEEVRPY